MLHLSVLLSKSFYYVSLNFFIVRKTFKSFVTILKHKLMEKAATLNSYMNIFYKLNSIACALNTTEQEIAESFIVQRDKFIHNVIII
jgi:hypothetical protein